MTPQFLNKTIRFTDLSYVSSSLFQDNYLVPILSFDTGSNLYVNQITAITELANYTFTTPEFTDFTSSVNNNLNILNSVTASFLTTSSITPQSFATGSATGHLISSSFNSETATTADIARFLGTVINALKANNILES